MQEQVKSTKLMRQVGERQSELEWLRAEVFEKRGGKQQSKRRVSSGGGMTSGGARITEHARVANPNRDLAAVSEALHALHNLKDEASQGAEMYKHAAFCVDGAWVRRVRALRKTVEQMGEERKASQELRVENDRLKMQVDTLEQERMLLTSRLEETKCVDWVRCQQAAGRSGTHANAPATCQSDITGT